MSHRIVFLNASPAIGSGGLFAVSNSINRPVTLEAQAPQLQGRQIWHIVATDPDDDTVKIFANDFPAFWSFADDVPHPDAEIVLTHQNERAIDFKLQPIDNGVPNAYTLSVAKPVITGATWYAGSGLNGGVGFTILSPDPLDREKPYWVLSDAD